MKRLFLLLISSTALTALLSLPAEAQEYSNGGRFKRGRQEATKTPVEAFGVHPPGPDPAEQNRCIFRWWKKIFTPYYAPASPTSTSVRWKPWCYFPLLPYYTPYYIGYLPGRLCKPKPQPYGYDGGWGEGPAPDHPFPPNPEDTPLRYGVYTSVLADDTIFWNMGGNGLVPYGTPRPPHIGPPDLVDAIQATRQQQYGGGGAGCACLPGGAPPMAGPAILPPAEKPDEKEDTKETKETPAADKPATPG